MTAIEYQNRNIPEYSDTMYLDGWSPQIILAAAHKKMIELYQPEEAEFEISGGNKK